MADIARYTAFVSVQITESGKRRRRKRVPDFGCGVHVRMTKI